MNLKFFVVLAAFVFPAAGAGLSLVIRDESGAPIARRKPLSHTSKRESSAAAKLIPMDSTASPRCR